MLKTLLLSAAVLTGLIAQTPATPVPSPSPSATPLVMPSPSAAPSPIVTPTPLPTPLVLPPEAPPQILAVQLSDPVFHGGETVTGTVITSTNVSTVEIHLAGRSVRMPRADSGVWQMRYHMPRVPFFMRGTYTAQVVATNAAGTSAERSVSVAIQ